MPIFRISSEPRQYGYSEHDAKVKVMGDFEEVKEDFENKEII